MVYVTQLVIPNICSNLPYLTDDKQYVAYVTQYNLSYPTYVPNLKTRSEIVPEQIWTEKVNKQTDTNILTEKAKSIYLVYTRTSYTGGCRELTTR